MAIIFVTYLQKQKYLNVASNILDYKKNCAEFGIQKIFFQMCLTAEVEVLSLTFSL